MKKYVSKDDVEKGLVDPTKPLKEQTEYLTKIEKEHPKDVKKDKKQHDQKRRERPERPDRPKYNWNRRDVTEETVVPKEPKKVVEKPDKEKFHNQLNALKKEQEALYAKKDELINEMKLAMRDTHESKRTGQAVKSKYFSALREKINLKKILDHELKQLEEKKVAVESEMASNKERIKTLKNPDNFQECSTEELKARIEKLENRLRTDNLDKKSENQINQKIAEMKRALQKSKPEIEVTAELGRLTDQNNLLYDHDLNKIRDQIKIKYKEVKKARAEIDEIRKEMDKEGVETADLRNPEEVKAEYDVKISDAKEAIEKHKEKIQKLKDEYFKNLNNYEDYFDLVSYIKMVTEEKQKIKDWKEEQERKRKERENIELQKQKQFEERQKKREERKKRDEERKQQEEERKAKLEKEKEEFINRNPHHKKIETCEALIDYCDDLRPENVEKKQQRRQEKEYKQIQQLNPSDNKEWKKELERGAEVIISKKLKEDEEIPKKQKKEKKKKEKEEGDETSSAFTHHAEISRSFQQVGLLPPLLASEIDDTIKQLRERIDIYQKPTEEQIATFKAEAEKEFEALHGFGNRDRKGHFREKDGEEVEEKREEGKDKYRGRKNEKKGAVLTENDFPELG